jgi:hypothetical protein
MHLNTYNRLKALKYENRGTLRMDRRLQAAERRREFAHHARLFTRKGLLDMPRFSPKYYETMTALRLSRFGILPG